jgi:hypothetical protein
MKNSKYILVCVVLVIMIFLVVYLSKGINNSNDIKGAATAISTPIPSMTQASSPIVDEKGVYAFLNEVYEYRRRIPLEADSKEQIIEKYERYFTRELSGRIVDSLYVETENGWKVPDGDGGYIFTVLGAGDEGSEVKFEFNKDYIKIRETYEIGMNSAIEYTIRFIDGKSIITEWIIQ